MQLGTRQAFVETRYPDMEEWRLAFRSLWKDRVEEHGGGLWKHEDPDTAPFLSVLSASPPLSL